MTKEHILREIKRISEASGGKPPGRKTFYNETGINERDWSGKFWPRWSDAILEAGFSPNKKQPRFEEEFLIQKLIQLARELGKFPAYMEMRLKAHKDKDFPSTSTFDKHFGVKSQLMSKVASYCEGRNGFEDISRMCESSSPKPVEESTSDGASDSIQHGVVYLIKSGRFYKIGKTTCLGRRIYDVALQLAEKPTTIHVIKTDDPNGIEAYWHHRFKKKRMNGEWFNLDATDVKAFKRWLRIA